MYVTFEMETKTNKLVLCVNKYYQKREKKKKILGGSQCYPFGQECY